MKRMPRSPKFLVLCLFALMAVYSGGRTAFPAAMPELPRVYVDSGYPDTSAYARVTVPPGGDLQAAINGAGCGTVIQLTAGATYSGLSFPDKGCTDKWIILTSSQESQLPPPGQRVNPAYSPHMPKIVPSNTVISAMYLVNGASNYRFVGLEITSAADYVTNLIWIDPNSSDYDDFPNRIVFDRVYVHGSPTMNIRRGIAMNSRNTAVIDSYFEEIHWEGFDSQAIAGWGGPGPFKITNNHLEAASETVAFGGAFPSVAGTVPSDIEIRNNYFYKPLSWKKGQPGFIKEWAVKNHFETKSTRRMLFEGNILENNWLEAQSGFAIVITPRHSTIGGGSGPGAVTEDLTFRNNIIRHSSSGVSILGFDTYDTTWTSGASTAKRILFTNNLWDDLNRDTWGGDSIGYSILCGPSDVTIDHETALESNLPLIFDDCYKGYKAANFSYRNVLTLYNYYGVCGSLAKGKAGLDVHADNYTFSNNVITLNINNQTNPDLYWMDSVQVGAAYPSNNFFPMGTSAVGFTDFQNGVGGDYALLPSSPYKNAGTDGRDIGADIPAVLYATRGAVSGVWNADASLSPTSQAFSDAGGTALIRVTSYTGGHWNAASNVSWITILSGGSGSGNGESAYSVAANSGSCARTGTLTIAGQTFTVSQDGSTGGGGIIAVDPLSIDFGQVHTGETSSRQIMISNKGKGPLDVRGIHFISRTLGIFSQEGACQSLGAGESCRLTVKFNPAYNGLFQGIMKIYSSTSNGRAIQLRLRGKGI